MTKLKRLKIHQFRNVRPCELVFGDRVNVLLGPNGAGKTTLLNFISRVLRSNLTELGEPFSFELDLGFPGGRLTGAIDNLAQEAEQTEFSLPLPERAARAARPGARRVPRALQFKLQVDMPDQGLTATIEYEETGLCVRYNDGRAQRWSSVIALSDLGSSIAKFLHMAIASAPSHAPRVVITPDVTNACRFDESLDVFRALTAEDDDESTLTDDDLQPVFTFVQVRDKEAEQGFEPESAFVEGIVTESLLDGIRKRLSGRPREISFNVEALPFLSKATRLMALLSAEAKIELIEKSVQQDPPAETYTFGNLKFWFTRKDGSIFQDHQLSYGQKRLLAFLYYLEANPSFVIADELVNGLHHAWIDECIRAIGDRQAFLTSQNPLLLDYLSFASPEEVKASFILCRTEVEGSREWMVWRNLTDDEADMFYSAYRVGIEHVSEILRTRGLW